jgi:hypothetical protein
MRAVTLVLAAVTAAPVLAGSSALGTAGRPTDSRLYVKGYENVLDGTTYPLTPQAVAATADGGSIVLATTQSPDAPLVNWLLKLDARGRPQWKHELGCLSLPPGDYTIGVSVEQTTDGGYVLAGGTIGCGSEKFTQQSLMEKLDSAGRPEWARTYDAGDHGSSLTQIRQTPDGGYVAVGNATDAAGNTGGLVLRLDGEGDIVWMRTLGPNGSNQAYLNAVQPREDGGVVAAGDFAMPGQDGNQVTSVLVVRLDTDGGVIWRRAFNSTDPSGTQDALERTLSIVPSAGGGYVVAGGWRSTFFQDDCCTGALLLKLDAQGHLRWQRAYSGGLDCRFGRCVNIGAIANSVRQAPNGRYLMTGFGELKLLDGGAQIVPWLAETDPSGNLLWERLNYEIYPPTGRPLSEYFAAGATTQKSGAMALGFTEDYPALRDELYAVRTDRGGDVPGCSDDHVSTALHVMDPALERIPSYLPVAQSAPTPSVAPVTTLDTSIRILNECG